MPITNITEVFHFLDKAVTVTFQSELRPRYSITHQRREHEVQEGYAINISGGVGAYQVAWRHTKEQADTFAQNLRAHMAATYAKLLEIHK